MTISKRALPPIITGSKTVPGAPVIYQVNAGDHQATVYFTPPFNGGLPINLYLITPSSGPNKTGASSPIVVTGLSNGVPITLMMFAHNAKGYGPPSNIFGPVTPGSGATLSNAIVQNIEQTETGKFLVTTNQATGTIYMVIVPYHDAPSNIQIKQGKQSSGAAAIASQTLTPPVIGQNEIASSVSGLTFNTPYTVIFLQQNGAGSESAQLPLDFTTANYTLNFSLKRDSMYLPTRA